MEARLSLVREKDLTQAQSMPQNTLSRGLKQSAMSPHPGGMSGGTVEGATSRVFHRFVGEGPPGWVGLR